MQIFELFATIGLNAEDFYNGLSRAEERAIHFGDNIEKTVLETAAHLSRQAEEFALSLEAETEGGERFFSQMSESLRQTAESFAGADNGEMFVETGKNMVMGLWEGISSAGSWLEERTDGFFGNIVKRVENLFGIQSPSRVFADIGEQTAKGFALGVESVSERVQEAVSSVFGGTGDYDSAGYGKKIESLPGGMGQVENDTSLSFREKENDTKIAFRDYFHEQTTPVANEWQQSRISPEGSGEIKPFSINIDRMEVRSEDDISRIARELYLLTERRKRGVATV